MGNIYGDQFKEYFKRLSSTKTKRSNLLNRQRENKNMALGFQTIQNSDFYKVMYFVQICEIKQDIKVRLTCFGNQEV